MQMLKNYLLLPFLIVLGACSSGPTVTELSNTADPNTEMARVEDNIKSKVTNEKLSAARAEAVEDYLKANNFITNDKISAKGFGDSKPIASNKTVAGRAQNRRVDVIITSEQVQ